ncbi:cGMP-dependent protein kinase [Thraustotheca clavata]|uniref:cGMP-dependent protein kinase n=1 Tax=Thraustotheca clavata TaxID=74557 RepID=A0A1V9Y7Q6_9STRA|nr:cGMP-dependent protein kinase [Thraustotheca clavata]
MATGRKPGAGTHNIDVRGDGIVEKKASSITMKSMLHACRSVLRRPRIHGCSIEPESEILTLPHVPKSEASMKIISTALRKHYLFQTLDDSQLAQVGQVMDLESRNEGEDVITQGDEGNLFYVLECGTCQVLVNDEPVAYYIGGQAFGELALLYNAPRAATVKATSCCTLWSINRAVFRKILTTAEMQSQKARLAFLKRVDFLSNLSEKHLRKIVDVLRMEYYSDGSTIIRQGDEGNTFYIIVKGNVLCSKVTASGEKLLVTLNPGQYFGERALLQNAPRQVNCTAQGRVVCYVLGRLDFTQLLGPLQPLLDRYQRRRTIREIALLDHLNDAELDMVAASFHTVSFNDTDKIIRQGEFGSSFYIIQRGKVSVQKSGVQVMLLRPGDCFGERSLMYNEPRAADCVAIGEVECICLDRQTFERCLKKLRTIMLEEAQRQERIQASILGNTTQQRITLNDLEKCDTIGTGTFGHVLMVKHKPTKHIYALKCMQKYHLVQTRQVENIINEKRLIRECNHPFILKLYDTFSDSDQLYMVLELIQGGELWSLLYEKSYRLPSNNLGGLDSASARFYAAIIIDVFNYLQSMNIAYRDLKPENLMIDNKGYLKIVDFGFAKRIPFMKKGMLCEKTYTVCGTQEYMAPEILLHRGYTCAVDHWALGCLIYELLMGHTPFYSTTNDDVQVVWNILHSQTTLYFPPQFDPLARDLIQKLLEPNPSLRLGSLPNNMQDIQQHPWFTSVHFDWTSLHNQSLNPPYIPPIKNAMDISQFGHFPHSMNIIKYDGDDFEVILTKQLFLSFCVVVVMTDMEMMVSYDVQLFEAFPAVCAKGKNGVQTCQALSQFLQDRANFEMIYSKQLAKIQQNSKSEDWAKQVANLWNVVQKAVATIALEHNEFANKHTTSIVAGIKACTSQQEIQIQQLTSEGLKIKSRYQEYLHKQSKAKERYEKKCNDALELLQSLTRKPPSESEQKSDIFSKVWDTTKNLGFPSQERQKQKIAGALDDILSAEKNYVRSVDVSNKQRGIYERSLKENLRAFEITEEQRLEYIKDLLLRNEKARLGMLKKIEAVISDMQTSSQSIDVLDDIEVGFVNVLGLNSPEFTTSTNWLTDLDSGRLSAIVSGAQSMSDQGVIFTHAMMNTLVEYISAEENFVQSLDKLSAQHSIEEKSTFFSSYPMVRQEGTTLATAWSSVVTQLQRVSHLHREFGSLLAEPVSLSLDTMKSEYDETKLKLDVELGQIYSTILQEAQALGRLNQRLESKNKEVQVRQAHLTASGSTISDKEDMLHHLGLADSPSERERKLGWKLDQLREEISDLQLQVDSSRTALLAKAEQYRQELQRILSCYMKNEKYRLDVKKSSLRSLVKAHEHLVVGLKSASTTILTDVDQISATEDIKEFIRLASVSTDEPVEVTPEFTTSPILLEHIKAHVVSMNKPKLFVSASNSNLLNKTIDETEDSNVSEADVKLDESKDDKDSLLFAMSTAEFQKVFNLPTSEQVVASFSCALYLNNFPYQGRLYLSQTYLCFTGWRYAHVVLPLLEISLMERKNTAIVVPNALELTTDTQGKLFFASFIYRDECMQSIAQLRQIQQQMQAIMTPEVAESSTVEATQEPAPPTSVDLAEQEAILKSDYDIVMDEALPFPFTFAYSDLWDPQCYLSNLLETTGETNVVVGDWELTPIVYAAFKNKETFQKCRTVKYTHNKKYMVGPSAIPTVQTQRVLYDANVCFVLSVTATVSDAPYHDYFRAESRWLFTPQNNNTCRLQTGVRLNWVKSTWLKKQIEGATASESKETMKAWTVKAIEAYKKSSLSDDAIEITNVVDTKEREVPTVVLTPVNTPRWKAFELKNAEFRLIVVVALFLYLLIGFEILRLQSESLRVQTETMQLTRELYMMIAENARNMPTN